MTEGACGEFGCQKMALFLHRDGSLQTSADMGWPRGPNGHDTHWTGRCEDHQPILRPLAEDWRVVLGIVKKSLDLILSRTKPEPVLVYVHDCGRELVGSNPSPQQMDGYLYVRCEPCNAAGWVPTSCCFEQEMPR